MTLSRYTVALEPAAVVVDVVAPLQIAQVAPLERMDTIILHSLVLAAQGRLPLLAAEVHLGV
jgi:hypothetical protein